MQPYYDPNRPREVITTFGMGDLIAILLLVSIAGTGVLLGIREFRKK